MNVRGWLRRLERASEGGMLLIPQRDGSVKKFPAGAARDAFANLCSRMGAGEDAPPEHPLLEAVRNSSDPEWRQSLYLVEDPDEWARTIPDLSE